MRLMDVKRLAASYGLTIDDRIRVRQSCKGKRYQTTIATSIDLPDWNLVWGADGLWDLKLMSSLTLSLGMFVPNVIDDYTSPEIDQQRNPEGRFDVDYKVANFIRNTTHSIAICKIQRLDELKQFFDDFYAKWAERRKIHKIQEISSIAGDYTV